MSLIAFLISFVLSATGVTITEPEDLAAYNLDELPAIRAIVENENVIPDSVHYSLNGAAVVPIPRLNTDWPTYMQNYQNHGYSESPAVTDNTILWTAPVTGDMHEFPTPVVVDGIVYYPQDSTGDSLYALNAATGEIIWKYRTGYTDDAVTVCDGYLYTSSDSLWCLNALTGERIWASGEADVGGNTPVVVDDRVFCGIHNSTEGSSVVACLDALTGEVEWSQVITGSTASCMALWNNLIIVPTFANSVYSALFALDTATGNIVWENSDSYQGYWDSSPVIVDGVIYIACDDGYIRGIDANTGETTWATQLTTYSINPTLSHHNGFLYLAFACIETSLGGIVWQQPYEQHGSSGIAGGLLSFGESSLADTSSVITLNCSDGSEVWRYQTVGGPWGIVSSPSIVDGVMYIAGTDWNLYAFGTGLKYTYLDETLNPEVGWNELVATSFDNGVAVASDTVNFYINPTGIEFEPSRRLLLTGSPNPFSSSTELSFSLPEPGFTSVEIYDLTGRCISDLVENDLPEGNHTVLWEGTDHHGNGVPAGLYMCRIQSGGISETTGLCLLR